VQQNETANFERLPKSGRIVAIDPGTKRVGVAVSDPSRVVTSPLPAVERKSWKKLLSEIKAVIAEYDAVAVVVGLPLNTDGSESPMSAEARQIAAKLELSLDIPVFLQDERVTTFEARHRLWQRGISPEKTKRSVDSEAAAVILADFIDKLNKRQ
jgi:putative Holliday junction resolvase